MSIIVFVDFLEKLLGRNCGVSNALLLYYSRKTPAKDIGHGLIVSFSVHFPKYYLIKYVGNYIVLSIFWQSNPRLLIIHKT